MRIAYTVGESKYVSTIPDLVTPQGAMRSNNIAEYQALISLLQHLRRLEEQAGRREAYLIAGDSELVIRQMKGEYRVRKPHLISLHAEASELARGLDVEFRAVPRERNQAGFLLE